MIKKALKAAFPPSLPIMAGYVFLGFGFGVLLQSKGYGAGWAVLMSATIFSGSMQYVAVDLLSSGASVLTAALMTVMINGRYFFYGFSLFDRYEGAGAKKNLMIFEIVDETYSIICSTAVPDGVDRGWYYFFLSALNHLYWIAGGALGAAFGAIVSFNSTGIEFVMTALFIVLFIEQWKSDSDVRVAAIGVGSTVVCLLVFGAARFTVPSIILICALLTVFRKRLGGEAQ